jgi:hypothetical protein
MASDGNGTTPRRFNVGADLLKSISTTLIRLEPTSSPTVDLRLRDRKRILAPPEMPQ